MPGLIWGNYQPGSDLPWATRIVRCDISGELPGV